MSSRDVKFYESEFPFKSSSVSSQPMFPPSSFDDLFDSKSSYVSENPSLSSSTFPSSSSSQPSTSILVDHSISSSPLISDSSDDHSTPTISDTSKPSSYVVPVRKSTRPKQPPVWMNEYVSCSIQSPSPYTPPAFLILCQLL